MIAPETRQKLDALYATADAEPSHLSTSGDELDGLHPPRDDGRLNLREGPPRVFEAIRTEYAELDGVMPNHEYYREIVPELQNIPKPETACKQESVLEEAQRITSGPRQRDYDHPLPNHERIAALWNAYLSIRSDPTGPLSAADVATLMLLLKLARNVKTPMRDNMVDAAGYARCLARIQGFEP